METTPLVPKGKEEELRPVAGSSSGVVEEADVAPVKTAKWLSFRSLLEERENYPSWRAYVHDLVEGDFDSFFEYFILLMIVLNVFAFIIGTIIVDGSPPCKGKCVTLNDKYDEWFEVFEAFSVIIFSIEYTLRVWSCLEEEQYGRKGPIWGRVAYATGLYPLIDVISILPWYLTLFDVIDDVDFTTSLRIFRLVRLLKAEKYLNAFSLLWSVLAENGSLLVVTLYYSMITWVICSTLLYFTERNNPELAGAFSSIPNSMFPTLVMLTGEYPYAEFSTLGKYIASIIAVIAVAIFAVPTAVIGSGFVKAIQEAGGLQFTVGAD